MIKKAAIVFALSGVLVSAFFASSTFAQNGLEGLDTLRVDVVVENDINSQGALYIPENKVYEVVSRKLKEGGIPISDSPNTMFVRVTPLNGGVVISLELRRTVRYQAGDEEHLKTGTTWSQNYNITGKRVPRDMVVTWLGNYISHFVGEYKEVN